LSWWQASSDVVCIYAVIGRCLRLDDCVEFGDERCLPWDGVAISEMKYAVDQIENALSNAAVEIVLRWNLALSGEPVVGATKRCGDCLQILLY
jgi:hypothetical protein